MPEYAVFILRFSIFIVIHSLLASNMIKKTISKALGREFRPYRLIYNIVSTVTFIWVLAAWRNSPVLYYIPGISSLIMYLAQTIIAAMLFTAIRQTGISEFLGLKQLKAQKQEPGSLATSGWYGIVRHPLYLMSLLFMILNPVMTAQWLLLICFSFLYFISGAVIEEKRLQLQFGDEYQEYCRRVPFLIPTFKPRSCNRQYS